MKKWLLLEAKGTCVYLGDERQTRGKRPKRERREANASREKIGERSEE